MSMHKHFSDWPWSAAARAMAAAGLCLLSACAPTTPHWDAVFGDSVRTAVAQQTLNPDAPRNPDPVSGIDGRAARSAIELYDKSFAKPEPQPNVFTIGVGSGGGGGR
jgi:hypothetical protein